jgi:ubiquitin-conjugating enzyme E2 O
LRQGGEFGGVKHKFDRFIRDHVLTYRQPPPGTVLVEWQTRNLVELVPTKHLLLVDRSLLVGDIVKRNTQDAMSGTVVETEVSCVLKPAASAQLRAQENHAGAARIDPAFDTDELLLSIPAEEIAPANDYQEGSMVIYHDWVGRIEEVYDEITIRLINQSVVEVENPEEVECMSKPGNRLEVGDLVKTTKNNIRRGVWKHGAYDARVAPIGDVVRVHPSEVVVSWLCRRLHAGSSSTIQPEPHRHMYTEMLGGNEVHVYDRSRSPRGDNSHTSYGRCVDFLIGSTVRFKDPAGAALKYDGTKSTKSEHIHGTEHRNLVRRMPRSSTLGFDLNVYTILSMTTRATVLWQNCSITHEDSTVLVPDINLEDESEVWPGEIVLSNETIPVSGHNWIVQPKKVGVVQSVSADDRLAKVLWLLDAKIQYHNVADLGEEYMPPSLLPGSSLGLTLDPDDDITRLNAPKNAALEDVTLYDIRAADGLNKRRGDFVILHPPEELGLNTSHDLDWIGEVVDLGKDGFLTVRLGALHNVRDIRIAPEFATIVYSSDMTHDHPGGGDELDYDTDEDSDGDTDLSEEGVWEAPNGEPIEEDSDAEAWMTESEGAEDIDMPEVVHVPVHEDTDAMQGVEEEDAPHTHRQIREETVFETAPSTPEPTEDSPIYVRTENTPPSFAILDSAPPDSTPYLHPPPPALSSSLMKRILKEHKILSSSLPDGIFVRTWESRLDLLRVLIVGPIGTPYEFVSFVLDMRLPHDYPRVPPEAYFHSWTQGNGPVNPNLYENGKICLSLLGTWHADEKGENWSPARSTILQVLVSLLGLVLVKEPYYNEAGFEVRAGLADATVPSALYSERTYFRSRGFIRYVLENNVDGVMDIIRWLYLDTEEGAPKLLDRALKAGEEVLTSGETGVKRAGLSRISKGALVMLKRELIGIQEARNRLTENASLGSVQE